MGSLGVVVRGPRALMARDSGRKDAGDLQGAINFASKTDVLVHQCLHGIGEIYDVRPRGLVLS